jgi:hypothetical protein
VEDLVRPVPAGVDWAARRASSFENLSELSLVDVVLPTRSGTVIKKRCISQPSQHQLILLQRLGLRPPASHS